MLEAIDIECVRGARTLFSGLSFALRGGQLLRIAGVNGSGKTSLLRIMCGLHEPARGEVRWLGENILRMREEFWRQLVYIGHSNAVKDDLTAAENVMVTCTLAGLTIRLENASAVLRKLGLAGCEMLPVRVLSQGQRRRVALARLALSQTIPLWVLDEPFTALDADAMNYVQELMVEHVARGSMVVYTTHHEAQIVAAESLRIDLEPAVN
jgi:heme exporter protein A